MTYGSVFSPNLFAGQVVIVTGGGSGIGRCAAHELAALGAQVALVGRKVEKLQKVADEITEDGGRVSFHVCDIRQEDVVKQTVAAIVSAHGSISGLVNNAGGQFMTPLEAITAKGWEAVVNTNLTGGFLMARECYLQSMNKNGGAIVNIVADMWGSMPGMGHSGAARAGMVSFTETAAVEWAARGRARQCGGPRLHCFQWHGQLPRGDGAHDPGDGQNHTCRALWHRGGNGCWHRVFAQPCGVLHQRHHAAHRRCAAAGPRRLPHARTRCSGAGARCGQAL
jgi:NADP-dependent 3-hydroxy acid dehydrogenase YdfG